MASSEGDIRENLEECDVKKMFFCTSWRLGTGEKRQKIKISRRQRQ